MPSKKRQTPTEPQKTKAIQTASQSGQPGYRFVQGIQLTAIILSTLMPSHLAWSAPQPTREETLVPSPEPQRSIPEKLIGTWKLTAPNGNGIDDAWMVLRPNRQESVLIFYHSDKIDEKYTFKYQISPADTIGFPGLVLMKMTRPDLEEVLSVLIEFHSDRQIRYEPLEKIDTSPTATNHSRLSSQAIVGTKTSNNTTVPAPNSGKKVARSRSVPLGKSTLEKAALKNLDNILRSQLGYRLHSGRYGKSLRQLGMKDYSGESYQYTILSGTRNSESDRTIVQVIPMVKGLRQYIGATYSSASGNAKIYENIICESDRPRNAELDNQAISFPTDRATGRLLCPPNYHQTQW